MQKAGVKKNQKCTLPRTETNNKLKQHFPGAEESIFLHTDRQCTHSHCSFTVTGTSPVPSICLSETNQTVGIDRKMMNGKKTNPDVGIQMPELKVAADSATISGPLVSTGINTSTHRKTDIVLTTLRLLCLFSSVMAVTFMTTAVEKATISIYGFHIPVYCKWSFAESFEYLVGMSAAVVAHSLLQLLLSVVKLIKKTPVIPSRNHAWLIFAGDQVFAYAMMSAGSAASGVTNLNRTGIKHSALPDFCKPLHRFCDRIAISIAFAFFSYFLLATSAVFDVMRLSKY